MKLIKPHKRPSAPVENWSNIASTTKEMLSFLNSGGFQGIFHEGLALSHAQVSENPLNFFVVHDNVMDAFSGLSVICNARIISADVPVPFKEACLSFPFRNQINTKRYACVTIEAEVHNPMKSFFLGGLSTRTFELDGLAAFIVQHEIDHARGVSIFERFKFR